MDRFAALFSQFNLHARIFHAGALCRQVRYDGGNRFGFIHLLRAGTLKVETEGQLPQVISTPAMIFYPGPVGHRLTPAGDGCDLVCAAIDFGTRLRNPVLEALPVVLVVPFSKLAELRLSLTLLFEEAGHQRSGRQAVVDRLAEIVVIQALRHVAEEGVVRRGLLAGLADDRLGRALVALHEEPGRAWSIEALAACAGMSRARFAVHFKKVVGQTPAGYLLAWRIAVAKRLLKQGRPLKLVSHEAGYATVPSFTRAFAGAVGRPPAAWLAAERASPG